MKEDLHTRTCIPLFILFYYTITYYREGGMGIEPGTTPGESGVCTTALPQRPRDAYLFRERKMRGK